MTWDVNVRGFLPPEDPLETLAVTDARHIAIVGTLENLSVMLPYMIEERRIREEIVHQLRMCSEGFNDFNLEFLRSENDAFAERAMMIYSYLASAYIYARHETNATRLPVEIAVPLKRLADRCGRPPILSYASYCLNNWRRIDLAKPVVLGNIELLQHFCAPESGQRDEAWFILIHVDIEYRAATAMNWIKEGYLNKDLSGDGIPLFNLSLLLEQISVGLEAMNKTLARMPEECSPDNYYRWVRPYIFGYKSIEYEGAFVEPQTFRGETGAQSTIVPALLLTLGIKHKDSMLTHHLQEMRAYMPPKHREFLQNLEAWATNHSLRDIVLKYPQFRGAYNECVKQLLDFRSMHFEYAVNYIAKKVENPEGTGGTPYIPWLQQLKDETQAHLIPE